MAIFFSVKLNFTMKRLYTTAGRIATIHEFRNCSVKVKKLMNKGNEISAVIFELKQLKRKA